MIPVGEIVKLTVIIVGSVMLLAAVWPWIRELFSKSIIPWVRERWDNQAADLLADLIGFVDGKLAPVRGSLRATYRWVMRNVLRMETTYTKTSATTAMGTTETFLMLPNGKVAKRIEEEEMPWEQLPAEIRSEFIRQNSQKGVADTREVLLQKVKEKAAEAGMSDELTYEQ